MRLRRGERDQRAFTPNQVVAQRVALARQLRGWTQEEAAERLEKFLGAKWSPATFSIVERSVDGKRIRQFTADELVALSRAFDLPIGWWFTPSWGDSAAVVVTPDTPDGLPSQLMVDVIMGDIDGFETWANELLLWASNQRVIVETATGKIVQQDSVSPRTRPWLDDFARLRAEMAIAGQFGDLNAAKEGLTRVLGLLDELSTPTPPPDDPPAPKTKN
jgi:transcriptional regulator with XRE-family HTH domain